MRGISGVEYAYKDHCIEVQLDCSKTYFDEDTVLTCTEKGCN